MKVQKEKLLMIASIVWLIAGFNILRIGIISYIGRITIINLLLSILVFVIFWFLIFKKLVLKHVDRIKGYEEDLQFIFNFFDKKSFFIMAFMMTFGIGIRVWNLVPDVFIAVFYTGLGSALFGAGILFGYYYFNYRKEIIGLNNGYTDNFKLGGKNEMKKMLNISFVYFWLAMVGGVFYREYTKYSDFSGQTVLGYIHTHLFALGVLFFLILALFCKDSLLVKNKSFKKFLIMYNIGLPFMVIMMLVRGIIQVQELEVSSAINGMISGFAGISHILVMVALIFLFIALKKEFSEKTE